MKRLPIILLATVVAVTLALLGSGADTARAAPDDVLAGFDILHTDPTQTTHDLNLPPDFFDPGCGAFSAVVALQGVPFTDFGIFSVEPGATDTIIERLQDAILPTIGSSDTIPIEIVRLELVSVSPVTVTGCPGGVRLYDYKAQVPEGDLNQVQGSMTIRHEGAFGGTFDSTLPVVPQLTFTRVDVVGQVIGPFTAPQIDFESTNVPWCHTADNLASPAGHIVTEVSGLTSNFFAGVTCGGDAGGGGGVKGESDFCEQGSGGASENKHCVMDTECGPPPPAGSQPCPVGGIAEAVVGGSDASLASPAGGSGSSAGLYAAIGAAAAAAVAVASAGWYARRRFAHRRIHR